MADKDITFTKVKLPYGWLGNMSPHPITFGPAGANVWKTAEALFQALRFERGNPVREDIRLTNSPMSAKMLAKREACWMVVKPRSREDLINMVVVLRLKVEQHPSLKQLLLDTGDARIIEDVTKRPRSASALFWGMTKASGSWEGENHLGLLWMELRAELRRENAGS